MLHGRDKIRVARDQYDALHGLRMAKRSDVEADPHIYAFLLEIGLEVSISHWNAADALRTRFPSAKLQGSLAHGEKIARRQVTEQVIRTGKAVHQA
jgi:hypothetical protein